MRTETLPQAIEYEESILSSCLFGDADQVVELLGPEDFYPTKHQQIFRAICGLVKNGVAVELTSLAATLRDSGELKEIGGASYLASLTDQIPVATNIEYFAGKIRDKSVLRNLLISSQETIRDCLDNSNESATIIDRAKCRLDAVTERAGSIGQGKAVSYRDLAVEAGDRYEDLYKSKGAITGIASGFHVLDSTLCGFQAGDLDIIAARPSMGKTALALNIAGYVASKGIPVAYFSLEMSASQLFDRQVAGESGINLQKFRTGRFESVDWEKITAAQGKVYGWPVYIDDTPALHYQEIRRRAWGLKKRHGIGLVIIDHLQLIKGDKEATRDREIGSITAGLKATAKELNLPVILLSQLNRQLEIRPNPHKRPKLSDLRDSGNIEQDADVITFLYRPAVYEDQESFPGHTELIIAKHRNGPTGMIKLLWNEKITTFRNFQKEI
ncbi:MAG: replicative DNA helicase [Thermodesulfobacteriota bacterium]